MSVVHMDAAHKKELAMRIVAWHWTMQKANNNNSKQNWVMQF